MIKLPPNQVAHQLDAWAECASRDISGLFQKFITPEKGGKLKGQFHRQCGINYGSIDKDWADALTGKVASEKGTNFALTLAVENGQFNILFEVTHHGNTEYYGSGLPDGGRCYRPEESPLPSGQYQVQPNYGLLPVVKDHLNVNWFSSALAVIPDLFVAERMTHMSSLGILRHHSVPDTQALDLTDPFTRMTVRARKYPIVGYNKKVLQMLLKDGVDDLEMSIQFGAIFADLYYNDDIFSPIIALKKSNPNKEETYPPEDTTYLDFVAACPPVCPPDANLQIPADQ